MPLNSQPVPPLWFYLLALLAGIAAAAAHHAFATEPPPAAEAGPTGPPQIGWTTPARVVSVYDGDTLTVEVRRQFRVRLLDLWSPEIRTRDLAEKRRGLAARDHLRQLLPADAPVVLQVPTHGDGADMAEAWSMGRVLGHVWRAGDRQDVSAWQRAAGHGTREKQP